jgi:hypothetical protein
MYQSRSDNLEEDMRKQQQHETVAARRSLSRGSEMCVVTRDDRTPGYGIGTIRLTLPKTTYTIGEAVEGTLLLSVSRPVQARGLFAILAAEQEFYRWADPVGKNGLRTVTRKVYHYQHQLDGEREYEKTIEAAAYPFRLMLPTCVGFTQDLRDPANGSATITGSVLTMDGSVPSGLPKWSVEGYFDLPLAFDVKEKILLSVCAGESGDINGVKN